VFASLLAAAPARARAGIGPATSGAAGARRYSSPCWKLSTNMIWLWQCDRRRGVTRVQSHSGGWREAIVEGGILGRERKAQQ